MATSIASNAFAEPAAQLGADCTIHCEAKATTMNDAKGITGDVGVRQLTE